MWYFTWILGIGVALSFGIINVLWLEAHHAVWAGDPMQESASQRNARQP
jgi:cyd operon protein YbgT